MITPLSVFFPQHPMENLAGAGPGHFHITNEVKGFGPFESGDFPFAEIHDLLGQFR
jgi:hypothetical protein